MTSIKSHLLNHENNQYIRFKEEEHEYWFNPTGDFRKSTQSVQFKGITGLIGSYSKKPFKPKKVAKQCNKNPNSKYYNWGEEAIIQEWDDRREKGNNIHKCIEDVVNVGVYDDNMAGYIDAFYTEMDKLEIEPFVSEFVVYDKEIGHATPIDLCGIRNNKLVILDIKTFDDGMQFMPYGGATFKHPLGDLYDTKFSKVSLQTSIEKKWLIDHYSVTPDMFDDNMYVVILNGDGCEVLPVMDYHDTYVNNMYEFLTETAPWE